MQKVGNFLGSTMSFVLCIMYKGLPGSERVGHAAPVEEGGEGCCIRFTDAALCFLIGRSSCKKTTKSIRKLGLTMK